MLQEINSNPAEVCTSAWTEGKKIICHPTLRLRVREMLRKETRAVKLVFLQRVKEVTTDRADRARQPTDTQYWFITFFICDRGTSEQQQLSAEE